MASWRHLSRVIVMQSFFEYGARGDDFLDILDYNLAEYGHKITDFNFAHQLAKKIEKHWKKILTLIKRHAPEWPIDKMDPVERSILALGISELLDPEEDVPVNVAINEAIELAKTYGDEKSGKFINGVLNAVAHDGERTKKSTKKPAKKVAKKLSKKPAKKTPKKTTSTVKKKSKKVKKI